MIMMNLIIHFSGNSLNCSHRKRLSHLRKWFSKTTQIKNSPFDFSKGAVVLLNLIEINCLLIELEEYISKQTKMLLNQKVLNQ
jgi:hypothetical protein